MYKELTKMGNTSYINALRKLLVKRKLDWETVESK